MAAHEKTPRGVTGEQNVDGPMKKWIEEHLEELHRFAAQHSPPGVDSVEAVNEVIYKTWVRNVAPTKIEAYLHRAIKNNIATQKARISMRGAKSQNVEQTLYGGRRDVRIDETLDIETVRELISALPQRSREVLEIVLKYDCQLKDAADILGISPEAARMAYQRAIQGLTDML